MPFRSVFAQCILAVSLCAAFQAAEAGSGGTITFVGCIVEPPCNFSVDSIREDRVQLRSACLSAAQSGTVTMMDVGRQTVLYTKRFFRNAKPIAILAKHKGDSGRAMIAVVEYQ